MTGHNKYQKHKSTNEHPETELSFLLTFRCSKIERALEKDLKCKYEFKGINTSKFSLIFI